MKIKSWKQINREKAEKQRRIEMKRNIKPTRTDYFLMVVMAGLFIWSTVAV